MSQFNEPWHYSYKKENLMRERRSFWGWFWRLFGLSLHYFVIDERKSERGRGRENYRYYKRRFWHFYSLKNENRGWQFHIETPWAKKLHGNWFSARFHIGNTGSETPWDGHLVIFGLGWYWGHSGFRKLASWLTGCSGYRYDSREWKLAIFDNRLWWSCAEHSDMCDKHRETLKRRAKGRKKRRISWRRGSVNLSLPEAIWGPYRYSYEDVARHQAVISLPEDKYAVILTLQKVLYGRTKVSRDKHILSWTVDVDAPRGIPTHVDHSGGWKGDRTFGFSVPLTHYINAYGEDDWENSAENAVLAWVLQERSRTGFVKPDPVGEVA